MVLQDVGPPPGSPPPAGSPARRRPGRRWLILSILGAVVITGGGLLYWTSSPPLTPAEGDLVGRWTIPIGPNPPPANAVRTIYEFGADRRLVVHSVSVSDPSAADQMTGTWRIEDDHLVMEAVGVDERPVGARVLSGVGLASSKLFGDAPAPPHMQVRFRLLGREGGTLRLEDQPGSVLPLQRVSE